jgi:shikimate kinase
MGCGKSTAGRLLAARIGYRFEDADDRIEEIAREAIVEIFRTRGEEAFREIEQRAIHDLLAGEGVVIASGGGAFARAGCADAILARAFTVHLACDFERAWARVAGQTGRPLAQEGESAMRALYADRKDKYSRAHAVIDTTRLSPDEVVDELLRLLPRT